jgi:CTP synthase
VERDAVIPLMTASSIYEVPLMLEESGLGDLVVGMLHLQDKAQAPDLDDWQEAIARLRSEKPTVRIALVGKYVELHDAYMSVREALIHAGLYHGHAVEIDWIHSETLEHGENIDRLLQADGIVVPGGFGSRGIEGKILAAKIARENRIPYLGLCLGMQVMCIEFARHVLQNEDANSTEFKHKTQHPIIALMPDQEGLLDMGGTMRLGRYPCVLQPGSKAHAAYGVDEVDERHRHRFEFNNAYREILGNAGMILSGLSPDNRLVEIAELRDHPWMLGSQFHPEFKSRLQRPHPLFRGFVEAAIERMSEERISE